MTIQTIQPFEELQKMCREMDAPVYVRHKKGSKAIGFVRRTKASTEDVERFFGCSLTLG